MFNPPSRSAMSDKAGVLKQPNIKTNHLIHETMKDKKKTRKIEFKKETIARLAEWQMNGVLGGTDGGNNSQNNANPCTHGIRTRVAKATCVNLLCKTQP